MNIDYQGRKVEVKEVEPITSKEEWNEYRLTNGKVLMIKTVLIRALEAVSEKSPTSGKLTWSHYLEHLRLRDSHPGTYPHLSLLI